MANLPSCAAIKAHMIAHVQMYQLVLPKIAPFCKKITKKKYWGGPLDPALITFVLEVLLCFLLHLHTYILYMRIHISVVCKNKKNTHGNFCPVSLLNHHSDPDTPPPLPLLCDFFGLLFENFVADENKYSGLGIPEDKFIG